MKRILYLLIVLVLPVVSHSAPIIMFSDLTDGPITGWDNAASKGAAVSIWCRNVGTSGTITVAGQTLSSSNSDQVAEWGATTTPTVPLGMQRITFWLNPLMTTGGTYPNTTITITVGGVTSNTLKFHTRTLGSNRIYIFDNAGSDTADGTIAAPKQHPYWFRQNAIAGDIAYFRSGGGAYVTGDTDSTNMIVHLQTTSRNNGTQGYSIAYVSYPGETAQFGNSKVGYPGGAGAQGNAFVFASDGNHSKGVQYLTISKLSMIAWYFVYSAGGTGTNESDGPVRLIGNDATTSYSTMAQGSGAGCMFDMNTNSSKYDVFILGNYFHDMCGDYVGDVRTDHRVYPIYIEGYGVGGDRVYIGYNFIDTVYNGRQLQVYAHSATDTIDNLFVFNNHFSKTVAIQDAFIFGQEGDVLGFLGNTYVYNNLMVGSEPDGGTFFKVTGGDVGYERMNFRFYNNTLYHINNTELFYITGGSGAPSSPTMKIKNNILFGPAAAPLHTIAPCVTTNLSGSNNVVYRLSGKPAWDTSSLTTDPKLTTVPPTVYTHFILQSDSPAKEPAGVNVSSDMPAASQVPGLNIPSVSTDFLGEARSTYAIGAFQYATSALTPAQVQGVTIRGGTW